MNTALVQLRARNKARFENPKFNKDEFAPRPREPRPAPPLDYGATNSTLPRRQSSKLGSNSTASSSGYSIPPELVEAARLVAESTPQSPTGDHEQVAASIRNKYGHKLNDTNAPKPLTPPGGRLHGWALPDMVANASDFQKRESGYWMVDMPHRGASPFAPAGYKVWRNVKDYGAVGNGVHDDTAAINAAISEGGRCGPNCGSSTVYPAVVYFPPGSYLVSTPIVQYYNTQLLGDVSFSSCLPCCLSMELHLTRLSQAS